MMSTKLSSAGSQQRLVHKAVAPAPPRRDNPLELDAEVRGREQFHLADKQPLAPALDQDVDAQKVGPRVPCNLLCERHHVGIALRHTPRRTGHLRCQDLAIAGDLHDGPRREGHTLADRNLAPDRVELVLIHTELAAGALAQDQFLHNDSWLQSHEGAALPVQRGGVAERLHRPFDFLSRGPGIGMPPRLLQQVHAISDDEDELRLGHVRGLDHEGAPALQEATNLKVRVRQVDAGRRGRTDAGQQLPPQPDFVLEVPEVGVLQLLAQRHKLLVACRGLHVGGEVQRGPHLVGRLRLAPRHRGPRPQLGGDAGNGVFLHWLVEYT
mmetsp:Transcript_92936/g.266393  ORF Transcript_92936/g.266393 Transcript_92936/m.266393 type:complete len:325 (+) Transcript_92936:180-1154(+)